MNLAPPIFIRASLFNDQQWGCPAASQSTAGLHML
jgi:hypothetical protein